MVSVVAVVVSTVTWKVICPFLKKKKEKKKIRLKPLHALVGVGACSQHGMRTLIGSSWPVQRFSNFDHFLKPIDRVEVCCFLLSSCKFKRSSDLEPLMQQLIAAVLFDRAFISLSKDICGCWDFSAYTLRRHLF